MCKNCQKRARHNAKRQDGFEKKQKQRAVKLSKFTLLPCCAYITRPQPYQTPIVDLITRAK